MKVSLQISASRRRRKLDIYAFQLFPQNMSVRISSSEVLLCQDSVFSAAPERGVCCVLLLRRWWWGQRNIWSPRQRAPVWIERQWNKDTPRPSLCRVDNCSLPHKAESWPNLWQTCDLCCGHVSSSNRTVPSREWKRSLRPVRGSSSSGRADALLTLARVFPRFRGHFPRLRRSDGGWKEYRGCLWRKGLSRYGNHSEVKKFWPAGLDALVQCCEILDYWQLADGRGVDMSRAKWKLFGACLWIEEMMRPLVIFHGLSAQNLMSEGKCQ